MKDLTQEEAHTLCVEMWNDIAENGYLEKEESDWLCYTTGGSECYACDYYDIGEIDCISDNNERCPFNTLGNKYKQTPCEDAIRSPYRSWRITKSKQHAIAIADLFIDIEENK